MHLIPTFDIARAETQEPSPLGSSAVHGVFWPVRTATAGPDRRGPAPEVPSVRLAPDLWCPSFSKG